MLKHKINIIKYNEEVFMNLLLDLKLKSQIGTTLLDILQKYCNFVISQLTIIYH